MRTPWPAIEDPTRQPPSQSTMVLRFLFFLSLATTAVYCYQPEERMRPWNCHGRTQAELAKHLAQAGIISSPSVKMVLTRVDRKNYISSNPYQDKPQSIGNGQTISAPHMHGYALQEISGLVESFRATEPFQILDVGCGSGYLTACFGRWMRLLDRPGKVYGIDVVPELVEMTRRNMMKEDSDLIREDIVQLNIQNGWNGWSEYAPFHAIHVGAAAASLPHNLALQLARGGVMIIPIGKQSGNQTLYKILRVDDKGGMERFEPSDYRVTELLGVRYVPLVNGPAF